MGKREIDYGNLTVANKPRVVEPEPEELPPPTRDSELLKDVAQSILLYVHPDAHRQLLEESLRRSSFRNRVRVHDLILEALEMYFESKALPGPVRAKDKLTRGKGRGSSANEFGR
jgi:hypothetical protein